MEIDFKGTLPLTGDVEIYLNHLSDRGKEDKTIARLRFNTAFIHSEADGSKLVKTFELP